MMKVGEAIRLLRTSAGLRQAELADRIGVSANYISLVENGKRDPSMSFLRSVTQEFGMPLGLLFLDMGESKKPRSPEEQALLLRIKDLMFEIVQRQMDARAEG
jgi:transcriptional regulator with XRE-family HTH domain